MSNKVEKESPTLYSAALNNPLPDSSFSGLRYDGSCKIKITTGFFGVPGLLGIYFSYGEDA